MNVSIARIKQRPVRLTTSRKRDVRTQFAALCWRMRGERVEVLVVTSRRTKRWILPKGWPMDGETPSEAAATEAWEEGGVRGKVTPVCIGLYSYIKNRASRDLPVMVVVFPLKVTEQSTTWPEHKERKRKWVTPRRASTMVEEPELRRLLRDFDPRLQGL
ncbi:MAG: NUDIX hydrolase [Rhodobacteraceae bacterium]|nr:NUDIX hydrolase [Paracoccaceae bacterium]